MCANEFFGLQLGDERLNKRCLKIVAKVSQNPGLSFPNAIEHWGELKGLYRFLGNTKVDRIKIMDPHRKCTVKRCLKEKVVLSIQDTTFLDYAPVSVAGTRVVQVCDREADIYTFIKEIQSLGQGFVIRCCRNRSTDDGYLYDDIAAGTVIGHTDIPIRRNGKRKARVAQVTLSICCVQILPPKVMRHKGLVLPVNIVRIEERNPPENAEPLTWLLLTSEPIATHEELLGL